MSTQNDVTLKDSAMTYEITQYLLDRANIEDTVTKGWMYLDMKRWDDMVKEAFADELAIDYTRMLGGEPETITGQKLVESWQNMIGHLDSTQHALCSTLIELPQPGGWSVPQTATVHIHALSTLRRDAAGEDPLLQNGSRVTMGVNRVHGVTGNPWRIVKIKVYMSWKSGNMDVTKKSDGEGFELK